MIATSEEAKPSKHDIKRALEKSDLQSILSDPEIRAALRDLMAGLSEALDRIERLENERRAQAERRHDPGQGSDGVVADSPPTNRR